MTWEAEGGLLDKSADEADRSDEHTCYHRRMRTHGHPDHEPQQTLLLPTANEQFPLSLTRLTTEGSSAEMTFLLDLIA